MTIIQDKTRMSLSTINNDCLSNIIKFIDEPTDLLNLRASFKKGKEIIDNSLWNEDFATESVINTAMKRYCVSNTIVKCPLVKLMCTTVVDEYSKNFMGVCWRGIEEIDDNFKKNNKNKSVELRVCDINDDLSFFKNLKKLIIRNNEGVVSGLCGLKLDILILESSRFNLTEQFEDVKNIRLENVNIVDATPFKKCKFENIIIVKCNELTNITDSNLDGIVEIENCNNLLTIKNSVIKRLIIRECLLLNEISVSEKSAKTDRFSVFRCPELTKIMGITTELASVRNNSRLVILDFITCDRLMLDNSRQLNTVNHIIAQELFVMDCTQLSAFFNSQFVSINCYNIAIADLSTIRNTQDILIDKCRKHSQH